MAKQRSFWDKFWKDPQGHVVLLQWPNIPLWTWIGCTVLTKIFSQGTPYRLFATLAFGSLFVWAWLEITEGSSYLRRLLGLIILVSIVKSRI